MTTTNDTASNVISSEKVEGTSVYNEAGDKLGSIDDLMIDKVSGHVQYAVLEFGGFMGADSADDERSRWRMVNGAAAVDAGVLVFTSGVHDASSVLRLSP